VNLKFLSALALGGLCALESAAWCQTPATDTKAVPSIPAPVAATPASAQPIAAAETPVTQPCCKVPALTPVEFEILTPASSKTSHQGEQIRIRVIEAVRVDGQIVVPAGTEGYAEVIQASRGAFGGKAGELVIGAPYLLLGSQRIDLKRFRYGPASGRDQTQTAMIVALAAGGIFGIMVGGGNIDVASGARAHAVLTRDTVIPVQPQVSTKE
jgi:hypothetical protein